MMFIQQYLSLPLAVQEHPSAVRSKESHQPSHIRRVRSQNTESFDDKIIKKLSKLTINKQEKSTQSHLQSAQPAH